MITVAEYMGNTKIRDELCKEFAEQVLEIMDQGGMMQTEEVSMYGQSITLLSKPTPDTDGMLYPSYSYFDDMREYDHYFDCTDCSFNFFMFEGERFSKAAYAICLLYEFHTEEFGIAIADGNVIDSTTYIGWLNYLFDEEYTNERTTDLCAIQKLFDGTDFTQNLTFLTEGNTTSLAATNAIKYLCLYRTTEFLNFLDRHVDKIFQNRDGIEALLYGLGAMLWGIKRSDIDEEEIKDFIIDILKADSTINVEEMDKNFRYGIYLIARLIPFEIVLKFASVIFHWDYDELYAQVAPFAVQRVIGFKDVAKEFTPIPPLSTNEFLGGISDDDRAYWWEPDGSIEFSREMHCWISALKDEFIKLLPLAEGVFPLTTFAETLINNLLDINISFGHVHATKEMFYDFVQHSDSKEVQAAMLLLQNLSRQCKGEMPSDFKHFETRAVPQSIISNPGRVKMKRFLAVMGNRELRKEVFGF